jgi:putative nucleotidyltransferase with HDIG domain
MLCEGFDTIKVAAPETFVDNIDSLMKVTKNFSQDNPHHSLDLYTHSKKTEAYVKERTDKGSVIEAALYHDIGKIWTKTYINASGEKTDIAHFYNHENVGAYMYLVAKVIDFEETGAEMKNNHALYVASLINWHMRPYLEMNDAKREREYEMLGEEFVKDILLIHEADRQAH